MSRYIEPDVNIVLKPAIIAKQAAYNNYKKILIKWLQSTWVGNDGNFCILKTNYYELLKRAEEEFKRATIEVEHYRMKVEDKNAKVH